ncbi:hypothetical protein J2S74_000054 [Evansella vedderi]|uniref:Uncharacterized protein n=1 Tax=Evansella vedderi TaxID=38282 RepID=A0ABT9ZNA5_9BACI|nr:hypothetical protein [Evansella vedderi]MDQ0252682.1 hypothetical protein [Evansella vedderi]
MKLLQKCLITLITCTIFFLVPQTSYGALWEQIPFEEMVERADLVVIGTYEGEAVERIEQHSDPESDYYIGFTDWKIHVSSYLKGEPVGNTILVTTPGATETVPEREGEVRMRSNAYRIDSIIQGMEQELQVEANEILFFLEEREGDYVPITPKAVVPLVLLDWEEYLTPEIIGDEEIDFEDESFKELEFLKEFMETTPKYSPTGERQTPSSESRPWLPYAAGIIVLTVAVLFFAKKRR